MKEKRIFEHSGLYPHTLSENALRCVQKAGSTCYTKSNSSASLLGCTRRPKSCLGPPSSVTTSLANRNSGESRRRAKSVDTTRTAAKCRLSCIQAAGVSVTAFTCSARGR